MNKTLQILDYVATQEESFLIYSLIQITLSTHSNSGYLGELEARSRAGRHFFLSKNTTFPPNNGAILTIAQIIKNVMSLEAEAGLGALYIYAREAESIRIVLEYLGHKQPRTPIQTENSTVEGVVNNKTQPKRTKSMDVRFYWLRDR